MDRAEQNRLLAEREYKEGKVHVESFPVQLSLYTTDTCNLKCIMCNIGQKVAPKITISEDGYRRVFDTFPYITTIALTGAELFYDKGNPSGYVRKIFDEGCKYPHLKFSGLSNGTLINEERARLVVDKFSWMNVSLDTTDPEEYARIRVGSKFNLVIRNLQHIRDLKLGKGLNPENDPRIGLCFIIMERTYKQVLQMVELAQELKARWIQFQAPWEGTLQDENIFSQRDKVEYFLSLIRLAEDKIKGSSLQVINRTYNKILHYFPDMKEQFDIPQQLIVGKWPKCCEVPYKEAYIGSTGNVNVCCTSPTVLGNINTMSFREIWNSEKALGLRERILSGNYADCATNCVRGYILPSR